MVEEPEPRFVLQPTFAPAPAQPATPPPPAKPKEELPNRQQIRLLTKDTPSMSADKPKLTPDCKLYWIQKHLEMEEEEQANKDRKMSVASFGSAKSENSEAEEEARKKRAEEEARKLREEERKKREESRRKTTER